MLYAKKLKQYNNRLNFENIKLSEINTIKIKSKDLKAIIFDLDIQLLKLKI